MIGREREIRELNRLYNMEKAQFVAIYGRRRVGKTYLVNETFSGRIAFKHAGLAPDDRDSAGMLRAQLDFFYNSLILHGMKKEGTEHPKNWLDAFLLLELFLQEIDDGSRQLVFFDELPWLDTPRSGFIRAFEGFWNTWGCTRKNLMVIVCGSANSWIMDNLINNHGGLYNRLTYEIKLEPFTLKECEELFRSNCVPFSRYDIVQSYMVFGGIPYYLEYMDGALSLAQNIDRLFFAKGAILESEFDRLFDSIFVNPEFIKKIVKQLYKRNAGFTRKELLEAMGVSNGGGFSRSMNALISSGFVTKYVPFGTGKREEHYKLVDPFCLFYLHFLSDPKKKSARFWQQNVTSQSISSWRGFAFENVCFNHIDQIKHALGISGVIASESAWTKKSDDEDGLQIDMLISRNDNVLNMCEIKYYSEEFTVDKTYYRTILKRQDELLKKVSPKTSIHSTLITTYGLTHNEYSGAFTNVITMNDLFLV